MHGAGIVPVDPAEVQLTGKVERFRVDGDKPGRRDGWIIGHNDDKPAARFGHWATGAVHSWTAGNASRPDPVERARWEQKTAEREQARQAEAEETARRAVRIWRHSEPCPADYPYLIEKEIGPGCARLYDGVLTLPIFDTARNLHSLQMIAADGSKRFLKGGRLKGCFIPVCGRLSGAVRVYIAEGWATGQSVAKVRPEAFTVAALNAGNLKPTAEEIRKALPDAKIIICADADKVGIESAGRAAVAVSGLVAVPDIPSDCEGDDFNDLMRYRNDKRKGTIA